MLSRIARGLYDVGGAIERAQDVTRILEVNHKMNLERAALEEASVWTAVSEAFECGLENPSEADLYRELVISTTHPYSVRHCIEGARSEARAMRDHISEEMWLHLNRSHLDLASLSFERILQIGRSEFNRRIELFANAFHGFADTTMIRGEAWYFLGIGRLAERASMLCRILEIKRKSLALAPEHEGAPIDFHQWQALLRSLSGYEPYRRAYDARIQPEASARVRAAARRVPALAHPRRSLEIQQTLGLLASQGPFVSQPRAADRRPARPHRGSWTVELHHRTAEASIRPRARLPDRGSCSRSRRDRARLLHESVRPTIGPDHGRDLGAFAHAAATAAATAGTNAGIAGCPPPRSRSDEALGCRRDKALLMVSPRDPAGVTAELGRRGAQRGAQDARSTPGLQRVVTHRVEVSARLGHGAFGYRGLLRFRYVQLLQPARAALRGRGSIRANSIVETTDAICCGPS